MPWAQNSKICSLPLTLFFFFHQVKHFGAKGRGVVTTRHFAKGEFVVEYIGDLIDMREAKQRETIYAQDASKGCYNYYFTFQNQQYW